MHNTIVHVHLGFFSNCNKNYQNCKGIHLCLCNGMRFSLLLSHIYEFYFLPVWWKTCTTSSIIIVPFLLSFLSRPLPNQVLFFRFLLGEMAHCCPCQQTFVTVHNPIVFSIQNIKVHGIFLVNLMVPPPYSPNGYLFYFLKKGT